KLLNERNLELIELTYKRRGGSWVLCLVVDKEGGVSLDECAWVNRALGEILDKEDIIDESYILEVSSPGLDRALKTEKDFQKMAGKTIKIHTYAPVEDSREHEGIVVSADATAVRIRPSGGNSEISIPFDKIAKAKRKIEFNQRGSEVD
ncbi:MAG: ribosome maturation factor RimP, partial [Candidatus Omnitrophota bacterium]